MTAYLARVMGPSGFGVISIGLSVLGYAVLLAGPGLNVLGTRQVAASGGAALRFSGDLMLVRLLLGTVTALLASLAALPVYGLSVPWMTVTVFALSAIPMAAGPDWYLQGRRAMGWLAASRLLAYAVYLVLVVAFVRGSEDTLWTAAAFTTGSVAGALVTLAGFARLAGSLPAPEWNPARWRELLLESLPLGLSSLLTQTAVNLPVLIVGAVLTNQDTGLFGAVMKLVFFVLMVDRIFYLLFLPAVSRAHEEGQARLAQVTVLGVKSVLLVALPVAALGIRFSDPILGLVYREDFSAGGAALAWAMPYFLLTVVNTVMMAVLFAMRLEKDFLRVMSVGTAVLVVLCGGGTLLWGIAGAAAGLSCGEAVMAVLLLRRVTARIPLGLPRYLPGFGAAAALMGVMLAVTDRTVLSAGLSVAVFLLSLVVLRGVSREDLQVLKEKLA